MDQSLDPRAEAEVPTAAEKVFIVQKVSRETNKKSTNTQGNNFTKELTETTRFTRLNYYEK